ncbi:hypothetical protein AK812_SmicGene23309 [Symbiodinium microadriaticum]|uniref:Uncharacterized protein n=1 Tax=Symbiodinium microadriaticum TaxID=2951 RepID=A0A1Q9DHK3_SYMMI|nr:hypothetical protein AK812_SmicGene23309 [Symbiodinium microadriaticum]
MLAVDSGEPEYSGKIMPLLPLRTLDSLGRSALYKGCPGSRAKEGASGTFSANASRLRREQEWQRCKTRLAIVAVFGFLALADVRRWRYMEDQEGFRDVALTSA